MNYYKLMNKCIKISKQFVGTIQEVIIENRKEIAFGHTSNYMQVEFQANNLKVNDLVKVKIIQVGYPISKAIQL